MNTANPYAAPTTLQRSSSRHRPTQSLAGAAAAAPMYSPTQVAAATFLGGMTAGGILMAANAHRGGRTIEAVTFAVGGLAGTIAIVALALMLPIDLPGMLFLLLSSLAMWGISKAVQGAECEAHITAGGEFAKGWKPVLIAVATGIVVGGALFATLIMLG
ncbi:MAG: hypothetical protein MPJ50_11840 [Pirellulales bacterium]|nr:hypothetical protein [Pirellulales bacterium]